MESMALFDDSKTYRYSLERIWDPHKERVLFIMLNPSSANQDSEDATSKRCFNFAKGLGFGSLEIVNLFAYIATNREELLQVSKEDAIGPENENHVIRALNRADMVIAAWGENCKYHNRHKDIHELFQGYHLHCLGKTRDGFPRHPLYLSKDSQPMDYIKPERIVRRLIRTARNQERTSKEGRTINRNNEAGGDEWMWCSICHEEHPVEGSTACLSCINKLVEQYHKDV
ncbi:DUF1643 domain-containing protein [Bacillus cereus]|uniref:DUF1643 domain-containing protein n=1 Tax=Bacillus cereus TaxID=1396 RepID=UPI000BFC08ED|nr:DUF1643 domain-containing protein [Bacillus cereus]MEA1011135.1 DUF1643 domain-containing protein [Bacillus cereus]PGT20562.1 hypothetical protein COC96_00960 [Bacillus cereus]